MGIACVSDGQQHATVPEGWVWESCQQSFSLEQLNSSRNAKENISSMGSLSKSLGRSLFILLVVLFSFYCFASRKN